jgi:hypothetical protein
MTRRSRLQRKQIGEIKVAGTRGIICWSLKLTKPALILIGLVDQLRYCVRSPLIVSIFHM